MSELISVGLLTLCVQKAAVAGGDPRTDLSACSTGNISVRCMEAPSLVGALVLCSRWYAGGFLLFFCQLVLYL